MALVVVFGAGGRLGRRVSVEAADRGHHVIGIVHCEAVPLLGQGVETVEGDVTDLATVRRVAQSADVLVATVGCPEKFLYLDAARTLVAVAQEMTERAPRIIHSGGGGSLLDPKGSRFVDTKGFPEAVRPEALGQAAALDYYRTTSGVYWVYMSPPPRNFEPGDRTGHYRVGDDHPVVDAQGRFGISYDSLVAAQPGVTAADPLVSILWGTFGFGEGVRGGGYLLLAVASAGVIAIGIVQLVRSPFLAATTGDPR